MQNKLTIQAFAEFCESKGDETFRYVDSRNCACAQYAKHLGVEYVPFSMPGFWNRIEGITFWYVTDDMRTGTASFAGLAARLRESSHA